MVGGGVGMEGEVDVDVVALAARRAEVRWVCRA